MTHEQAANFIDIIALLSALLSFATLIIHVFIEDEE